MEDRPSIRPRFSVIWVCMILSAIALIAFIALYYLAPFAETSEYWDKLSIYLFYPPFALFAAITGTLLVRKFAPGEPPRRVWLWFTLGWWAWVTGELLDTFSAAIQHESIGPYFESIKNFGAGAITIMDLFWSVGYLCFGLALYFQFRNISKPGEESKGRAYFVIVAIALLVGAGLTQLAIRAGLGKDIFEEVGPKVGWLAMYMTVLYPVFDIALGLSALALSIIFGGRRWGRPWWGLISFAIADALSTWIWIGGVDKISESAQNTIWLVSDSFYVAGYLIAGLGFLSVLTLFSPVEDAQE